MNNKLPVTVQVRNANNAAYSNRCNVLVLNNENRLSLLVTMLKFKTEIINAVKEERDAVIIKDKRNPIKITIPLYQARLIAKDVINMITHSPANDPKNFNHG